MTAGHNLPGRALIESSRRVGRRWCLCQDVGSITMPDYCRNWRQFRLPNCVLYDTEDSRVCDPGWSLGRSRGAKKGKRRGARRRGIIMKWLSAGEHFKCQVTSRASNTTNRDSKQMHKYNDNNNNNNDRLDLPHWISPFIKGLSVRVMPNWISQDYKNKAIIGDIIAIRSHAIISSNAGDFLEMVIIKAFRQNYQKLGPTISNIPRGYH